MQKSHKSIGCKPSWLVHYPQGGVSRTHPNTRSPFSNRDMFLLGINTRQRDFEKSTLAKRMAKNTSKPLTHLRCRLTYVSSRSNSIPDIHLISLDLTVNQHVPLDSIYKCDPKNSPCTKCMGRKQMLVNTKNIKMSKCSHYSDSGHLISLDLTLNQHVPFDSLYQCVPENSP